MIVVLCRRTRRPASLLWLRSRSLGNVMSARPAGGLVLPPYRVGPKGVQAPQREHRSH